MKNAFLLAAPGKGAQGSGDFSFQLCIKENLKPLMGEQQREKEKGKKKKTVFLHLVDGSYLADKSFSL